MNTQSLISGYASYADADELVPAVDAPGGTITITVTSSQACISAASAISAVSIDNTFDHSC